MCKTIFSIFPMWLQTNRWEESHSWHLYCTILHIMLQKDGLYSSRCQKLSNEMLESIRSIGFARFSMAFCFWPSSRASSWARPSLTFPSPASSMPQPRWKSAPAPALSLPWGFAAHQQHCNLPLLPSLEANHSVITSEQWKFRESSHKLHLSLQAGLFTRKTQTCQDIQVLVKNLLSWFWTEHAQMYAVSLTLSSMNPVKFNSVSNVQAVLVCALPV